MSEQQSEEQVVRYYPLDAAALQKGDYLSPEWCEKRFGIARNEPSYRLELMRMKSWIERARAEVGQPVVLKCERDGIRVLVDEEAAGYTTGQFEQALAHARRSFARKVGSVDVGNLTAETRKAHERDIEIQSRKLQAIKKADAFTFEPYKRQTPGLPERKPEDPGGER